jgi:hypothetical protein
MSDEVSESQADALKAVMWVAFVGIALGLMMNVLSCIAAYNPIIRLPPGTEARPLGLTFIWMLYCIFTLVPEIMVVLFCVSCGWRKARVWCFAFVCLGLGVAPFYLMPMMIRIAAKQAGITFTF